MSIFDSAIKEGIESGMYSAFSECIKDLGDCYDEPQERCVMRPRDGCACLYARWTRLPWYRRIFAKAPKKPSLDSVKSSATSLMVSEAVSNARIEAMKSGRAR